MRPLKLTFEGLNSFEKRQSIDFARLTEARLFGIFGPTGSGKSTILDAMTLALYGEVVRAPHKTGGILNTRCDDLFVEMEFSLGAGESERVYRVMRAYSRDKDGDSLKVKRCSLRRVDEGQETVICAEKSFEVTQKVRQLLGLTMGDFVHSVVLPQGQFAEFLNMTGKDRRDMLERLFHLEEFGRALAERVRQREQSVQGRVGENEAALRELADVSEERLKEARVRRELDAEELGRVEQESQAAEREAAGLRALYERAQERKTWQVKKLEHDAARSRISLMNAELDAARRAQQVLPLAEELGRLERETAAQRRTAHESVRAHENAADYNAKVAKEAEARRPQLSAEQQALQKRIGALETLIPRQQEMNRLTQEEREMMDRLSEARALSAENDRALEEKRASVKKGEAFVAEQENLSAQAAQLDMEKLGRGAQLERDMEDRQTRYADTLRRLSERAAELNSCMSELNAAQEREQALRDELSAARAAVTRAEDEFIAATTRHAAAQLARSLGEGERCPVCGSTHHPQLAVDECEVDDGREQARQLRDDRQKAYSDALREIARLGQARESQEQAHAELQAQAEALRGELSGITAEWERLCREAGASSLSQAYSEALERQNQAQDSVQRLAKARAKLDSYRRQLNEYEMERLKLHNLVDALDDKLKLNRRSASGWAGELKRLELPVDADICAELDKCRSSLEHIEHTVTKMDDALRDARRRVEETQKRAADQTARLDELERQCASRSEQLGEALKRTGFADVDAAARAHRSDERVAELEQALRRDADEQLLIEANLKRLASAGDEREVTDAEMSAADARAGSLRARAKELTASLGALERQIADMDVRLRRKRELEAAAQKLGHELDCVTELRQVLRGNSLVEYVANQYLIDITRMAGERLMFLTAKRYDLELGEDGFIVRDMDKGGAPRATSTLSGGETFLVSLSLALSLSMHINLRGQPLGFFFLDEGFGTLDDRLLGTVMDALAMLARDNFAIGVISHVGALKERIPAQLVVTSGPEGSAARVEFA